MDSSIVQRFAAACRADSPLDLVVEREDGVVIADGRLEQPFAVLGRENFCDIQLNDPAVCPRHAFLQVIGGHVFVSDLGSRTGISWAHGRQPCGWLIPGEPIHIGPYALYLTTPVSNHPERFSPQFHPLAPGDDLPPHLMEASIEFRNGRAEYPSWQVNRLLTLMGRSPDCKINLTGEDVSLYHCYLMRSRDGLWIVDLFGRGGVQVSGERQRIALLQHEEEFQIGQFVMACRYPAYETSDSGMISFEVMEEAPNTRPDDLGSDSRINMSHTPLSLQNPSRALLGLSGSSLSLPTDLSSAEMLTSELVAMEWKATDSMTADLQQSDVHSGIASLESSSTSLLLKPTEQPAFPEPEPDSVSIKPSSSSSLNLKPSTGLASPTPMNLPAMSELEQSPPATDPSSTPLPAPPTPTPATTPTLVATTSSPTASAMPPIPAPSTAAQTTIPVVAPSPSDLMAMPMEGPLVPMSFVQRGPSNLDPSLVPFLRQLGDMQGQMFLQFQQSMMLMMQMFGQMQREQMSSVQQELSRMTELNGEMVKLQTEMAQTMAKQQAESKSEPEKPPEIPFENPLPAPEEVPDMSHETAAQHHEVWERMERLNQERQSIWQRLMSALNKS